MKIKTIDEKISPLMVNDHILKLFKNTLIKGRVHIKVARTPKYNWRHFYFL